MLTQRQKEVLDFILGYIEKNGHGPTLSEIGKELKIATVSGVHQHVEVLSRKGFLKKLPFQTRSISGMASDAHITELPILGSIALGKPIESFETTETIKVPASLTPAKNGYYALKARGNSMDKEGILDGDTIIVRQTSYAENGDIIVAIIKGEGATLKRYHHSGSHIELRPYSSDPLIKIKKIYNPNDLIIQGKFVGLIRTAQ